jgi:hypothetical protein
MNSSTHDVIVVRAVIEFEHRHAALKMMAGDETGGLELSEHAINSGKPNVLVGDDELFVNVLSTHVACRAIRKDFQNFEARQRYFQARVAQVIAVAGGVGFQALRHAGPLGYDGFRLSII